MLERWQVGSAGLPRVSGSPLVVGWSGMASGGQLKQFGLPWPGLLSGPWWRCKGQPLPAGAFQASFVMVANIPLAIKQVQRQNGRGLQSSMAKSMNIGRDKDLGPLLYQSTTQGDHGTPGEGPHPAP